MKLNHDLKKQAKFLTYILGIRPDEFGLVPDKEGYVKIKDLSRPYTKKTGGGLFVRQPSTR